MGTSVDVKFDANKGLDQLSSYVTQVIKDIPDKSAAIEIDVQIANTHPDLTISLSNTGLNQYCTAEDSLESGISPGHANVASYYLEKNNQGYACRDLLVYTAGSFSFAMGWYLLNGNHSGSWVTCIFDKDVDLTQVGEGDLGPVAHQVVVQMVESFLHVGIRKSFYRQGP